MLVLVLLCAAPIDVPLEHMTPDQLRVEYQRVEDTRPSLAPPILLFSGGGAMIYGGLFAALWAALEGVQINLDFCFNPPCFHASPPPPPPDNRLYTAALSLVVAGAAAVGIGIWRLLAIRHDRYVAGKRLDAIEASLAARNEPLSPPGGSPTQQTASDAKARERGSRDPWGPRDPGMSRSPR